ncbi:ubiquinol--cytochrome-c reductase subunit COR1 Ecym_7174 [Eremothecium cymbalariae DBVPG|uniref:Peptidase M16 N-terminal domain-containing protein n=1 Tax=Eremothecium cymbalariae (strain CBS 270.75 / DBVPG 7215 / KCTC 17166 / NRRL Y-17582) TaxID=931890 RepID=G8JW07_ERECY|nr:hypothetical protein Ecym_7174 [Eremothecium cymbalariae DBVPG\
MLRSISRSSLLRRSIATQAAPRAEITELSNGLVVATEPNSNASTVSVGIVFGSGASSENPYNNGVSNLATSTFRSVHAHDAMKHGFSLSSVVDKEYQSYIVNSVPTNASKALEFLQSKLLAPISESAFQQVKTDTLNKVAAFEENDHAERVMEHLHATAFQNTPLSLPKRGTVESLADLEKVDLESFAKNHFIASNAVVVASGNISHDDVLKSVESLVRLPSGSKPVNKKKSSFLGSEVRMRDDTLPKAWISLAAEGEAFNSPHYYVAQVAAQIFGSYVAHEPSSNLQGIKLLDTVREWHLADSFNHFSTSYKDSGLWGFSTVISNIHQIDDLMHFTLKQWNRLSISITDTEVARGKALLKLNLANAESDTATVATILGAQTLAFGAKPPLSEVFAKIDAITSKDIKNWAGEKLWDQDIAIAGTGQIEGLLDYMRMRNGMSMMRW